MCTKIFKPFCENSMVRLSNIKVLLCLMAEKHRGIMHSFSDRGADASRITA